MTRSSSPTPPSPATAAARCASWPACVAEGEDLIPLMGWLVNQLQLALRLANARDFAAQARAERLWPAREQLFRKALRRAPREHWLGCLARASRIDRMAKGREWGDPWLEAERLIAAIAEPRAAAALG